MLFFTKSQTFFGENLIKTVKHDSLADALLVLAKTMPFYGSSKNPTLLETYSSNMVVCLKRC